ncbi:hypothetical protein J6590_068273 [Homalodisca vitripennis]|nr:hypothetical protein J6590_068273 [Homalodisca vitripennis]
MADCMIHKAMMRLAEPQYLSERLLNWNEDSHRSTLHDKQLSFRRVRLEVLGRISHSTLIMLRTN